MHRPTIKDVAQRAKVSLKTVSRVINNEASMRGPARDRVQRAIEELKYEPDQSARRLRTAGYPCVYVDDRDAAYDITEHLIQLGRNPDAPPHLSKVTETA